MEISGEIQKIQDLQLDQVLSDQDFSLKGEILISGAQAREKIKNKYPDFCFNGLNEDGILEMTSCLLAVNKVESKAQSLEKTGNLTEAEAMFLKAKLVGDPDVSFNNSSIKRVMESVNDNIPMAASFLRIKKNEYGIRWLNFIVRTWGVDPNQKK